MDSFSSKDSLFRVDPQEIYFDRGALKLQPGARRRLSSLAMGHLTSDQRLTDLRVELLAEISRALEEQKTVEVDGMRFSDPTWTYSWDDIWITAKEIAEEAMSSI